MKIIVKAYEDEVINSVYENDYVFEGYTHEVKNLIKDFSIGDIGYKTSEEEDNWLSLHIIEKIPILITPKGYTKTSYKKSTIEFFEPYSENRELLQGEFMVDVDANVWGDKKFFTKQAVGVIINTSFRNYIDFLRL